MFVVVVVAAAAAVVVIFLIVVVVNAIVFVAFIGVAEAAADVVVV